MIPIKDFRTLKNPKALGQQIDSSTIKLGNHQSNIIRKYIGELKGLKAIGREIHSDPRSFRNMITELGIEIPRPGSIWKKMQDHYSGKYDITHSSRLENIIRGSMLGDGNISVQTKGVPNLTRDKFNLGDYRDMRSDISSIRDRVIHNPRKLNLDDISTWNKHIPYVRELNTAQFRVHKSIKEIRWVKSLADEFEKAGYELAPFVKKVTGNPSQEIKWTCGFDTKSSVQLFDKWLDWYKIENGKNIKVIPSNVDLFNPDSLLHMYMGDGHLDSTSSKGTINIASHSFTKKENHKLVEGLRKEGIEAKVVPKVRKTTTQYYLRMKSDKLSRRNFFDYISNAQYYDTAEQISPHKFNLDVSARNVIDELKKEHPEYFNRDADLTWENVIENL